MGFLLHGFLPRVSPETLPDTLFGNVWVEMYHLSVVWDPVPSYAILRLLLLLLPRLLPLVHTVVFASTLQPFEARLALLALHVLVYTLEHALPPQGVLPLLRLCQL